MSRELTKRYGAPLGYKVTIKHTSLTNEINYAQKVGIVTARGIPSALGMNSVGINPGDNALLVRFANTSEEIWFNENLLKFSGFRGLTYMIIRSLNFKS